MEIPSAIEAVISRRWNQPVLHAEYLGNHGGLSGAALWRFRANHRDDRSWLLRLHPLAASKRVAQMRWIHSAVRAVSDLPFIASPIEIDSLSLFSFRPEPQSIWGGGQRWWQIEPWLDGEANYWTHPTEAKIVSAAVALGQFHAIQSVPFSNDWRRDARPVRCVAQRVERLLQYRQLIAEGRFQFNSTLSGEISLNRFADAAPKILSQFQYHCGRLLAATPVIHRPVTTVCFRDIWHDHLLFENDSLSGIVDYDAMAFDAAATDLARMGGSMFGGSARQFPELWNVLFRSYREQAAFGDEDVELTAWLDEANSVLAPMTWLDWLFVQRREFEDLDAVSRIFDRHVQRLVASSI